MNKRYNFQTAKFYDTINDLKTLPTDSICEIAICGRSNAGKSTLINILTNKTRLAFTSKTPGRTQHINLFNIEDDKIFIADLPGYGFAHVKGRVKSHWEKLLSDYLTKREEVAALVLIMDSRHPMKELDFLMLDFFLETNRPVHIILSKVDKLNQSERVQILKGVKLTLEENNYTNVSVQLFSSIKRIGLDELDNKLNEILNNKIKTQE